MMFLMENWYLVVALMAVAGMVGVCIGRFLKMPTSEQRERVKEWLLWAVTQAEAELGSGTGKLKLRQTYDLFIQRFPALAMAVSFDTFSLWVDEALEEMRKLLKENKTVRELVKGRLYGEKNDRQGAGSLLPLQNRHAVCLRHEGQGYDGAEL